MRQVLIFLLLILTNSLFSQESWEIISSNDFENTTEPSPTLIITIDTLADNLWQISSPGKNLFNSAFSDPNVIITDSLNTYPINNTSSFQYKVPFVGGWGETVEISWMQKLDLQIGDKAIVEYSIDNGQSWQNMLSLPNVTSSGYNVNNLDTLTNGEVYFTGRDSNWTYITFNYYPTWPHFDSTIIRHRFESDSIESQHEGWMIDNIVTRNIWFSSVNDQQKPEHIRVFPNPTDSKLTISINENDQFHMIKSLTVVNELGEEILYHEKCPSVFYLDLEAYEDGAYFIYFETDIGVETKKIVLVK